jgi:hypothetical protein
MPDSERALLQDRHPEKPSAIPRLPARTPGGAAGSYLFSVFKDPSTASSGYYAEKRAGRDSGTPFRRSGHRFVSPPVNGMMMSFSC